MATLPTSIDDLSTTAASNYPASGDAVAPSLDDLLRFYGASIATLRDRSNTVSVTDAEYGAVGDGTTDDTAAIQTALDTGKDVFIPPTNNYYRISSELTMLTGQRLYGVGQLSVLRQVTTFLNVIAVTSKTDVIIEDLRLYCVGDKSGFSDGGGVYLNGCSRATVRNISVVNHAGDGVQLRDTNDSVVSHCLFANSAVVDGANNGDTGADIAVAYSSSRNRIIGNLCKSGNATGIKIQSVVTDDLCDDNVVMGNVITGMEAYGIIAYRNDESYPSDQSVRRTVIANNAISDIAGSIINETYSLPTFGAGIYLQGAEETVVSGNTIKNTHFDADGSRSELLAPGAIGCGNSTRFSIVGNVIEDAGMAGIFITDTLDLGEPVGNATVAGNIITNCARAGIAVNNKGRLNITGNTIDTCGTLAARSGIRINYAASAQYDNITVNGNTVMNVTGVAAIDCNYVNGLSVSDNVVDTSSSHGITANNSSSVSIRGNVIKAQTNRGVQIASGCTGFVSVTDNTIVGTGSSTEGIRLDAAARYAGNLITGCTAEWAGDFAAWKTFTDGDTTPSVLYGSHFIVSNSSATTITTFDDGYTSQEIWCLFVGSNTTLDFSSGSLKGNGGTNRTMAPNDMIHAIRRGSLWYVTVVDA